MATQISTPQTLHYYWHGIWVRAPTDPMHLGLKTGPLCYYWHGSITDALLYRIFRYAARVRNNSSELIPAKGRLTHVSECY
jgi:hypothetical protein